VCKSSLCRVTRVLGLHNTHLALRTQFCTSAKRPLFVVSNLPCRGRVQSLRMLKRYIHRGADKSSVFSISLFAAQPKEFFLNGLKKLEQRSHKCVELMGEYVQYIHIFNPVACCFDYKAKDLSAPPHVVTAIFRNRFIGPCSNMGRFCYKCIYVDMARML
jgi:hypothetical protein